LRRRRFRVAPRRRVWPVGLAVIVLGAGAGAGLWITHANSGVPAKRATVSVTPAKPPLVIRSEVPAAGATGVASDAGVTVTFSRSGVSCRGHARAGARRSRGLADGHADHRCLHRLWAVHPRDHGDGGRA